MGGRRGREKRLFTSTVLCANSVFIFAAAACGFVFCLRGLISRALLLELHNCSGHTPIKFDDLAKIAVA